MSVRVPRAPGAQGAPDELGRIESLRESCLALRNTRRTRVPGAVRGLSCALAAAGGLMLILSALIATWPSSDLAVWFVSLADTLAW